MSNSLEHNANVEAVKIKSQPKAAQEKMIVAESLDNKIYEGCYFWYNSLKKDPTQLKKFNSELLVDDVGNLVFKNNDNIIFKITAGGTISFGNFNDISQLLSDLLYDTQHISTFDDALQILSQMIITPSNRLTFGVNDGEIITADGNSLIQNANGFTDGVFSLVIPTLSANSTIALSSDIPSTSDISYKSLEETITGMKTFTSTVKISNGIYNTNYNVNLMLPTVAGTLVSANASSLIQNINGFIKDGYTLSVPTLSSTDAIVTTKTHQTIDGIKTFTAYTPFTKGFYNTQTTANIKLPTAAGTLVSMDVNSKIQNTSGFTDGTYTLSIPTLTSNKIIATTSDIPSSSNFITTDNTSQIATGTKRFYDLRVGDGTSTDAYIGIHDSYGIRAFSFPKVFGRLMADTDGVTTNTVQSITKQKRFKSGIIVDSGGTAVFANSSREIRSASNDALSGLLSHYLPTSTGTLINENYASTSYPMSVGAGTASYGSGLLYARSNHNHSVDTNSVCTLTATQTLTNKTLDSPTFKNIASYSTSERKNTGNTWIDGKIIYRKVITGTTRSSSGVSAYAIGDTVDKLINVYGCLQESDGTQVYLGYVNISSGAQFGAYTTADRKSINLRVNTSSMFSRSFWMTLEYTV